MPVKRRAITVVQGLSIRNECSIWSWPSSPTDAVARQAWRYVKSEQLNELLRLRVAGEIPRVEGLAASRGGVAHRRTVLTMLICRAARCRAAALLSC